jgi:hypothetical protein
LFSNLVRTSFEWCESAVIAGFAGIRMLSLGFVMGQCYYHPPLVIRFCERDAISDHRKSVERSFQHEKNEKPGSTFFGFRFVF